MRVLLISHTCQSRLEGQPRAHQLARLPGVDLHVLVPDRWWEYTRWRTAEPPAEADFGYTAGKVRLAWGGPAQWYLHHYPGLAKLMRAFKPDIIDIWEESWGLVSAQACRLRNRLLPEAKIISETEQNVDKRLPLPFEWMRSYTLSNADFVIGRNAESLQVLGRKGYTGPSQVVPNAVDTDLFKPMDRAACRAELGLVEDGTFWVGYIGRLVVQKGLGDLIAALERCPATFRLLLVGEGPFEPQLRAQVEALRLGPDRVKFMPPVPMHKVAAIMNALDVFVLPSRTTPTWKEQFGRVIIEAHACGTPVIGSDSGAIPTVIGEGGLTFPEQNAEALAASMRTLSLNAELRYGLGEAGRRQVQGAYTWQRVAEQVHAIYERVLRPSAPAALS